MKKQLPTDAIKNELAESSIFFHSSPSERPNGGVGDPTNERTVEQPLTSLTEQAPVRPDPRLLDRTSERLAQFSQEPQGNYPTERPRSRVNEQANERTGRGVEQREKAERYSFEIYPSQKEQIEEYVYHYKRRTGKRLSASKFIREAIDYHFKTLNRHGINR